MLKKLWVIFMAVIMCLAIGPAAQASTQVVPGGIGDKLVFPLYDLRLIDGRTASGWQNFLVVENTSNKWTAFHLRFRAHKYSIEVWDHVILLSPYDVFWCALENDGADGVRIISQDSDTLYNSGMTFVDGDPYTGSFDDALIDECGAGSIGDLLYGHIEVIGLFQLDLPLGWMDNQDTHDLALVVNDLYPMYTPDGIINVYDLLNGLYYDFDNVLNPIPGQGWLTLLPEDIVIDADEAAAGQTRLGTDCDNVLAANFIMGDLDSAEMGMENFIAMENFRTLDTATTPSDIHRDGHLSGAIVFQARNVNPYLEPDIFYTSPAWYLNPDWATQVGPTERDGDDDLTVSRIGGPADRFNEVWSLNDVETALAKTEVWYNYFQDSPFLSGETYTTDVILTFETKYLHIGWDGFPYWNKLFGYAESSAGLADYYLEVANFRDLISKHDDICLYVTVWDMDENNPPDDPPVPSPGEWRYPICIDFETNVMRFSNDPGAMSDPTVLYSPFPMGHFRIDSFRNFDNWSYTYHPDAPGLIGLVYFRHTYGAFDFVRSAMAEWHYSNIIR